MASNPVKTDFDIIQEKIKTGKINIKQAIYSSDAAKMGASKSEVGVTRLHGKECFYKVVSEKIYQKYLKLQELQVGVKVIHYDNDTKHMVMEKGVPLDEIPFA